MSDDKTKSVLGAAGSDLTDDALLNAAAATTEKTPEEIAAEEAKAEEEFLATPEDTITNPLVPEEPKAAEEEEISLEGAIGSGNLEADYPEEKPAPVNNEANTASVEEEPAELTVDHSAPAETPAPAPAPVAEQPVAATPAATEGAAPKKKSKKGLIITLIIIFLLLIGGGVFAIIWFMNAESPENMLKDALSKFWGAENIQTTATITSDAGGNATEMTLDAVLAGANLSGSGKLKVNYQGKDININYSAAYSKDGVAYFKIDNLKNMLKDFGMDTSSSDEDEDDEDSLSSAFSMLADLLSSVLNAVVEKVDGNWFKITAADAKELGNTQVSCMLENLKGVVDSSTKKTISEAYGKNPFLKVNKDAKVEEKDGVKYFKVTVDKDAQKKFTEETKNIDSVKKLSACFESESSEDATDNAINEMTLGIKPWSHELVSISGTSETKNGEGEEPTKSTISAKLSYDKKDVTMPSDAKDVEYLKSAVVDALKSAMTSYADKACQAYSSYGAEYVQACKDSMSASLDDIDYESLFGSLGLGGGSLPISL